MEPVFSVIRYHVWWPGSNDPFWLYNQPDVQNRNSYYGNNYAPHCFFDGALDGTYNYGGWTAMVDNRSLISSDLQITLSGYFDEGTGTGQVTVAVYAEATPGLTNLRLRTALVESALSYGGRTWNQVYRDMFPSTTGEIITISQGQTLEFTYDLNITSPLTPRNCQLMAFVQSEQNHEILQSAKEYVTQLVPTSVEDEISVPSIFSLSQNYPNPFNATTQIDFRTSGGNTSLAIYDITGALVKTLVDGSLEAGSHSIVWDGMDNGGSDVASGIYFYRLSNSGSENVRRMTLLK